MKQQQSLEGTWVTRDGYIRQQLLPGGRYQKSKVQGQQETNYTGSYTIRGNRVRYIDDRGHEGSADFLNGMLYCKGYVFYKEDELHARKWKMEEEMMML
ncbi:MAG: Atu4866 domain-containing protein [Chitinophagaceae bacterium]